MVPVFPLCINYTCILEKYNMLDNDKIIKDREGKNTIVCSKQWYFQQQKLAFQKQPLYFKKKLS